MLESVLVAVIPTLLTTVANLIETYAANRGADPAQVLAQMQAALTAASGALAALQTAHAARVAALETAVPVGTLAMKLP